MGRHAVPNIEGPRRTHRVHSARVWTRLQATEPGAPTLDAEAERQVLRILSFASSVLEQNDLGLVTPKFWHSFRRNFCGFLQLPAVSAYWETKIATGQLEFSEELISLEGECGK